MQFFSTTWTLLLIGCVTFAVSLLISIRGPSRAQMLLMWMGLAEVMASAANWAIRA